MKPVSGTQLTSIFIFNILGQACSKVGYGYPVPMFIFMDPDPHPRAIGVGSRTVRKFNSIPKNVLKRSHDEVTP